MPVARNKLLAYAQLVRLPNLFTAVADPLAGWFVAGGGPAWQLPLLLGASACLYTGGIVLNDCFDYELDCQQRPERPLPSGAIARRTAWTLGVGLLLGGLVLAGNAGLIALTIAGSLALVIMLYNGWAKRFAALGPLTLGACRFGNFLLGMPNFPSRFWIGPVALGVYVTVLSGMARHEETNRRLLPVIKRLLLGIIVLDALVVACAGDWVGALLVLSLLVPAFVLSRMLAMT